LEIGCLKPGGDLFSRFGPHVEDFRCVRFEIGSGLMKKTFDGPRETGGNFDGPFRCQAVEPGILAGGHFTQIGDGVKRGS
jgi:hypothetical protein